MKYFAYGSNMNAERMEERGVEFSGRERAILEGWILKFNTVASQNEGYANIVLDEKGIVEGILYEIQNHDLKKLDKYEEYPDHYKRIKLKVRLDNGERVRCTPDHKFRLRDGTYSRADKLKKGQSLMPLKIRFTEAKTDIGEGYEMVWMNHLEEWWHTHHLADRYN